MFCEGSLRDYGVFGLGVWAGGAGAGDVAWEDYVVVAGGAPGAVGDAEEDKPTLTVYLPAGPNVTKTGVVVAPGGVIRVCR